MLGCDLKFFLEKIIQSLVLKWKPCQDGYNHISFCPHRGEMAHTSEVIWLTQYLRDEEHVTQATLEESEHILKDNC
jgi:hypothetical protein